MEVSIGRDRGQEPYNRECPDHIGAVGTYAKYQVQLCFSVRDIFKVEVAILKWISYGGCPILQ